MYGACSRKSLSWTGSEEKSAIVACASASVGNSDSQISVFEGGPPMQGCSRLPLGNHFALVPSRRTWLPEP